MTSKGGKHENATIALVAIAHGNSHMMQLALPPLFVLLYTQFNVSFTELGLVVTLLYASSGLAQAPAGMLADRYGAHRLMIGGTAILSGCIALYGVVPSFWMLMPLAVIAGLGNSVFHPADLSVLSHRIQEKRLGRAFALHNVSGMLGYALMPGLMTALAAFGGWRFALISVGLFGVGLAVVLWLCQSLLAYEGQKAKAQSVPGTVPMPSAFTVFTQPVILTAFFFFAFSACAGLAIQTFSVTAMTTGYGVPLALATAALTSYLVGSAGGQLVGGHIADRTENHVRVAVWGLSSAVVLLLLVAALAGYGWFAIVALFAAGFSNGATGPSRDVLIRRAAAGQRLGGTFGVVYSGFDLGSLAAPLMFGFLLDHGLTQSVFIGAAIFYGLAIPTVLEVRRRITVSAAQAAAAE